MKYGVMTIDYSIKGARNQEEIDWVKSVALDIYNKMADESENWTQGFNTIMDLLEKNGVRFDNLRESTTDFDPMYEFLYDEFCRAVYREFAKNNGGVRNNRIIQLDGIYAARINRESSKATLYCTVEDLN